MAKRNGGPGGSKLQPFPPPDKTPDILARIDHLEDALTKVADQFTKLVETLTQDRETFQAALQALADGCSTDLTNILDMMATVLVGNKAIAVALKALGDEVVLIHKWADSWGEG